MKINQNINQSGMASIMFAMFLVLGISLLAIGFATLVRNDQRQVLDKTLSNQAQYAAESAINKVQSAIKDGTLNAENLNCNGTVGSTTYTPSFTAGITVTCLTWDLSLDSIKHNALGSTPWFTPFNASSDIKSIKITWQPGDGNPNSAAMTEPQSTLKLNDTDMPTIRVVMAQTGAIDNAKTAYLSPTNQSGTLDLSSVDSGAIGNASCNTTTRNCEITINTSGLLGQNNFLSISSLNDNSNVQVRAFSSNNGSGDLAITGAQAKITANAKSQDVSKRLVAYVPLSKTTWLPGFVASADALCKNYALGIGGNAAAPPGSTNPACPQ